MMDGSVADTLPSMVYIESHLEQMRQEFADRSECLLDGIDAAYEKLGKYFKYLEESPVYVVATVCDPRRNMKWVQTFCKGARLEKYLRIVREFFDSQRDRSSDRLYLKEQVNTVTWDNWLEEPKPSGISVRPTRSQLADEEFLAYTELKPLPMSELRMEAWIEGDYMKRFPTWGKMAVSLLPIPSMSSEPERVHSRYLEFEIIS
jgi:hypothetical protein